MAVLYRCPTPTNWLCPCGKVARALKRSGVEYETVRMPYRRRERDEVAEITGQRHVPVVMLDGPGEEPICDSKRIVEHLEWLADRAATPASRPESAARG